MAWYWPDLDSPQSAKTAVVNAVGVSALFAVWLFLPVLLTLVLQPSRRTGRLWLSLTVAFILAMIGWGIHRMSRTAAIAGVVWWSIRFGFSTFFLIAIAYRTGNLFGFIWPALNLLFLLFYVIAVRATFAYYRHFATTPTVVAR
jgi:CheY-like chemotaxis protein